MSASRTIFGTYDTIRRPEHNAGWPNEFERIFVQAARSHGANAQHSSIPHPHEPLRKRGGLVWATIIKHLGARLIAFSAWRMHRSPVVRRFLLAFAIALAATVPTKAGDWTVVTMARDGSWGVATSYSVGQAIALAIRECRAMAGTPSDCGAQFAATRDGFVLANLCGDRKIIVAAPSLDEAEAAAGNRETRLREHYAPDLPPCRHALMVGPNDMIVDAQNTGPDQSGSPAD